MNLLKMQAQVRFGNTKLDIPELCMTYVFFGWIRFYNLVILKFSYIYK